MDGRDRYRAVTAAILVILGVVILVRTVTDLAAWPIAILAFILIALRMYRLNQVREYLQSSRR